MTESFGKRLRKMRESMGLTVDQVIEICGLKRANSWYLYEKGDNSPKVSTIAPLFDRGVSPDWLIMGQGAMMRDNNASTTTVEPEGPILDRDLMETVIRLTEEALQSRNQNIVPDKKAVLFSMIHDMILEQEIEEGMTPENSPVIADKINNLIRLAS